MGIQPEYEVARQIFGEFQLEGSLANISCHEDTAEVITRLDMPKDHLSSIGHVDTIRVFFVSVLAL